MARVEGGAEIGVYGKQVVAPSVLRWRLQNTIVAPTSDFPAGTQITLLSPEPFVVDGRSYVVFTATTGVTLGDPAHVYVSTLDGTEVVLLTSRLESRSDAEPFVPDPMSNPEPVAFIYYSEFAGSFGVDARLRASRIRFVP